MDVYWKYVKRVQLLNIKGVKKSRCGTLIVKRQKDIHRFLIGLCTYDVGSREVQGLSLPRFKQGSSLTTFTWSEEKSGNQLAGVGSVQGAMIDMPIVLPRHDLSQSNNLLLLLLF